MPGNHSHALSIALGFSGRTGRPRSRGRVAGDEGEHRRWFDDPAECRVREPGGNGSGLGGRRQSRRVSHPGGFAVWWHSHHEQNKQNDDHDATMSARGNDGRAIPLSSTLPPTSSSTGSTIAARIRAQSVSNLSRSRNRSCSAYRRFSNLAIAFSSASWTSFLIILSR